MRTEKKLKVMPIALALVLALAAIVFFAVVPSAEPAYAADILEQVTADAPNTITSTSTDVFEIKLSVQIVDERSIEGKGWQILQTALTYDKTKVQYIGCVCDEDVFDNTATVTAPNAADGLIDVYLKSSSKLSNKNVPNFVTFKFKLINSAVAPGDNLPFTFNKASTSAYQNYFVFSYQLASGGAPVSPKVSLGTLSLPEINVSVAAPAEHAYLTGLNFKVPGRSAAITLADLKTATNKVANTVTEGNTYAFSGEFTVAYDKSAVSTQSVATACTGATVEVQTTNCTYTSNPKRVTLTTGASKTDFAVNTIVLKVIPQSGDQAKASTYTIVIRRPGGDTDATIKNANNNGVKIKKDDTLSAVSTRYATYSNNKFNFDPNDPVLFANRADWTLVAEPNSSAATVKYLNQSKQELAGGVLGYLTEGDNTRYIRVTPEMGNAVDYEVHIYVAQGDTVATLSSLAIKYLGNVVPFKEGAFNANTKTYTVELPDDAEKLDIVATATSAKAVVNGANPGKNAQSDQFVVSVQPEKGDNTDYTINVTHLKSDAELKNLAVVKPDNTTENPLNTTDTEYSLYVEYAVTSATVSWQADEKSRVTVKVDGEETTVSSPAAGNYSLFISDLSSGATEIEITVTAEAGIKGFGGYEKVYTLALARETGETDTTLSSVRLTKSGQTPIGATLVGTTYTANDTISFEEKDGWTLVATKNSSKQNVLITDSNEYELRGTMNLVGGSNTFYITVSPEDGDAVTYTVIVNVGDADTNGALSSMSVKVGGNEVKFGRDHNETFSASKTVYNLFIDEDVTAITIDAAAASASATVTGAGDIDITGLNSVSVVVTAQNGVETAYTIAINRQSKDSTVKEIKLTLGGEELETSVEGNVYTVNGTVDYDNHNKITLTVKANSDKAYSITVNGNERIGSEVSQVLDLKENANEIIIYVTAENRTVSATPYKVVINVVKASADTTLAVDPTVFSEDEELHVTKVSAEMFLVRYHVSKTELSVFARANDPTATVSVIATKEGAITPVDGQYYKVSESIVLTEEMTRLIVIVTAQSGDRMNYIIYLSAYGKIDTEDPENPEEPVEEPDYIKIDFAPVVGDVEGTTTEVGIKREEGEKKFVVEKGTETATFSIKVEKGVTIDVLYGAIVEETGEVAASAAEVEYADVVGPDGVTRKFKVNLIEGNNPIVFKVNETGIVGADEIYVLNIYRPVEPEIIAAKKGGWIAGIVVLAVLLAAAIVLLVLFILKGRKGNDENTPDDGEKEEVPAEETPVEETPAEEPVVEEVPAEEPAVEETPAEEETQENVAMPAEKEVEPAEEPVAEETPAEEPAAVEETPVEETPVEEVPVEEPVAEEIAATEEPVAEETPAEEPAAAEETPVEEPAEEEKKEEIVLGEGEHIEEAIVKDGEKVIVVDEDDIHIKNVQTHKEKYDALSREQKTFYDELKLRAMAIPGAVLNSNKSNETIRIGQRRVMKLMIRREFVVACFFAENENVTELKKALRGKDVRINTKETEIPIYDVRGFDAACDMIRIVIDSFFKK